MYTELRSMRCVAHSYPFAYPPAQSLYLERDHNVPGWNEKVKYAHDTSQFWHWIWHRLKNQ